MALIWFIRLCLLEVFHSVIPNSRYIFRHTSTVQGSYTILKINFHTFSRPEVSRHFPDLTFPHDLPRPNIGTAIFNTISVKLYQSWMKYYKMYVKRSSLDNYLLFPYSLFWYYDCSSPRCTIMFSHCVLLHAVSHNFPWFLHKPLKLLMKVKRWAPLAHFPGILPLRARSSSSPLRITWPKNLSRLCSIQKSSLRSCPILWRTDTLVWCAVHGMQRILW